jgi:uncharacterized membrane protein
MENENQEQPVEEQTTAEEKTEEKAPEEQKQEAGETKEAVSRDLKLWGVLAYLGVLVLIPLFLKKDSEFVQFHAKQGLLILIGWIIAYFPFGFIFWIASFVLSVMGIVSVLQGEKKELPLIGELAAKIKL